MKIGNPHTGLYNNEHRYMYNKSQHVFYCCVALLINNSMSLGTIKIFLLVVYRRQDSAIVLRLLGAVSS